MNEFDKRNRHFILPGIKGKSGEVHNGISYVNAPGWILNVNGVAAQLFNFENRFRTPHASLNQDTDPADGDEVNRIFKGWHYNFSDEPVADGADQDGDPSYSHHNYQIDILNGDGGIDSYRFPDTFWSNVPKLISDTTITNPIILYDVSRKGHLAYLTTGSNLYHYSRLVIEKPDGTKVTYKIVFDMRLQDSDFRSGELYP